MRQLIKITLFSVIITMLAGCSATRKRGTTAEETANSGLGYNAVMARVRANNITENGFILKKGRIEIGGSLLDGSYSINARYNKKGDLSASVRGPLGIEIVRLISAEGNIYLIDRINRIIYKGKESEVIKRYGLPENVLALILGDMISSGTASYSMDGRETMLIEEKDLNRDRILTICIKEEKVCGEVYRDILTGNVVKLEYRNFRNQDGKRYPSEIIMEQEGKLKVGLRIDDITLGYDEEISTDMPSYRTGNL